jgi:hypothetical protein
MNRLVSKLAARRARLADDKGASLVLALIFITVVAVVMGVVLSYAETNLRTTVAMRGQAARAAAADGAAKVAINQLRRGTYDGTGDCFGTAGTTLPLPSFYTVAGTAGSAAVSCAPDTTNSVVSPITGANTPATALLTLGTAGDTDASPHAGDGIYAKINGSDDEILVKGGVAANSKINIFHGELHAEGGVKARGTCSGTIVPAVTCPNVTTNTADPDYGAPTLPTNVINPPVCNASATNAVQFNPGRYTNVTALNDATKCANLVYNFRPGTYYFDFNGIWTLKAGYVIGGTMTGNFKTATPPTNMATACESPVPADNATGWIHPAENHGVTFVFGGEARMYYDEAKVALCWSYSAGAPPVVVYGLKTTSTNCITQRSCALISTDKNGDFQAYMFGTVYAPQAYLNLDLKKALQFYFRGGVIAHNISIDGPGNTGTPTPMVAIPDRSTMPNRSVVWLNVYVCPAATTCAATGTPRLRAKINITTGTNREITVLSWSVQR